MHILLSLLMFFAVTSAASAHERIDKIDVYENGVHARLVTDKHGMHVHLDGQLDAPNHSGTVWWRIYNRPEHCAEAVCTSDDAANPEVRTAVFLGGGYTTDAEGYADIRLPDIDIGTCRTNRTMEGREVQRTPWCFESPDAQVEVVIRSHGVTATDMKWAIEQKTTHSGGCNPTCESIMTIAFPR